MDISYTVRDVTFHDVPLLGLVAVWHSLIDKLYLIFTAVNV